MSALDAVYRYHDGTKHHFNRFARSLGYLDWASQPAPFRSVADAPEIPLPRRATLARVSAPGYEWETPQDGPGSKISKIT